MKQKKKKGDVITNEEKVKNSKKAVKKRKIKIRLADPNVPDSYICEVYDSSFENEDNEKIIKSPKPKSYFDILMSKESRRSFNVISSVENENIPEETKLLRVEESNDIIKERKEKKEKNREKLNKLVNCKKNKEIRKKGIFDSSSESSEDESLFQIQTKLKSSDKFPNGTHSPCNLKTKSSFKGLESNEFKENKELDMSDNRRDCQSDTKLEKKKNSNILSYFAKVDSIPEELEKVKPKCKKPRKLKEINMFGPVKESLVTINYEHEEESDVKIVAEKKITDVQKKNIKLAPLFQKKVKSVVDPEVQKARLEFLHSGMPSSFKKTIEARKVFLADYEVPYFPVISHVQQKDESLFWRLNKTPLLKLKDALEDYNFNASIKKFNFRIVEDIAVEKKIVDKPLKMNDDVLNSLKCKYNNVDVVNIFKGVQEKQEKFFKKIAEVEASKKVPRKKKKKGKNDSIEVIENESDHNVEVYNSVWTEKYRPKSSEILGNKQTVKKLSSWLEAWKAFDEEVKRLSKMGMKVKSKKSSGNSSDDFITSDEEDGLRSPGNICILTGPTSSGKTALVFSLANELEFNVIEVNASSKRTGKKLLTELQEATKSHKVHHDVNQATLDSLVQQKKKKQKVKKNKKKIVEKIEISEQSNNCKISLILIEDADIVFEDHDEGFFPAVASLVQSSKRPVIFLSNDPNCSHLHRFKTQQCLLLNMYRPNLNSLCAVLDSISLFEGVETRKEELQYFVQQNGYDLRRCLLELQFWIQNGQSFIKARNPILLGNLWWGCNNFLYNKEIKHQTKPKTVKRKRINDLFDSSEDEDDGVVKKAKMDGESQPTAKFGNVGPVTFKPDKNINAYGDFLENLSFIDQFHFSNDLEPFPSREYLPKDSLSLSENLEDVKWAENDLSNSIASHLIEISQRVFVKKTNSSSFKNSTFLFSFPPWEEIRWRDQQNEARNELIHLVPFNNGNLGKGLNLDYLPLMRNICRTEKDRFVSNTKRKNRFYHYLRTLGADPSDDNLEINCEILGS